MYLETLGINIKKIESDNLDYEERWIIDDLDRLVNQYWRTKADHLILLIENKESLDEMRNLIGDAYIISEYLRMKEPVINWTEETINLTIQAIENKISSFKLLSDIEDSLLQTKEKQQYFSDHIEYYNELIKGINEAREIK